MGVYLPYVNIYSFLSWLYLVLDRHEGVFRSSLMWVKCLVLYLRVSLIHNDASVPVITVLPLIQVQWPGCRSRGKGQVPRRNDVTSATTQRRTWERTKGRSGNKSGVDRGQPDSCSRHGRSGSDGRTSWWQETGDGVWNKEETRDGTEGRKHRVTQGTLGPYQ